MTDQIPDGTNVIGLWAVPRSVSTAFEKAFSCRADSSVSHEPFTDCYYFGSQRRCARYGDQPHKNGFTGASAVAEILADPAPVVFTKDLAFQAGPYLSDELLAQITNTFIVRHPRTVLRSLTPLKPDFTEDEYGFTALARLFRRVTKLGQHPRVVVEGDDFRRNPDEVLRAYCLAVGLRFDEAMLHWEDGRIRNWTPDEEQSQAKWHRTLEASHTVLPPTEDDSVPVPPERAQMYQRALDIYQELSRFTVLDAKKSVAT